MCSLKEICKENTRICIKKIHRPFHQWQIGKVLNSDFAVTAYWLTKKSLFRMFRFFAKNHLVRKTLRLFKKIKISAEFFFDWNSSMWKSSKITQCEKHRQNLWLQIFSDSVWNGQSIKTCCKAGSLWWAKLFFLIFLIFFFSSAKNGIMLYSLLLNGTVPHQKIINNSNWYRSQSSIDRSLFQSIRLVFDASICSCIIIIKWLG